MMLRRLIPVVGVLATLVAPLAAQAVTNFVTTDPVQPAPALGMPLLVLLAVVLAGVGVYRMRLAARGSIALAVLAGVIVLAGIGYAIMPTIMIKDAACMMPTTTPFNPFSFMTLMSECSNPIKIVALEFSCTAGDAAANIMCPTLPDGVTMVPICEVGLTLGNNASCKLPNCCVM